MASVSIKVKGTALPDAVCRQLTGLKRNDELLWSEGTGRSASSGTMTGAVVAEKKTFTLEFGPLTASQYASVRSAFGKGSYAVEVKVAGSTLVDGTFYRGTLPGELMGVFGGAAYYGGVAVELVEW